MITALLKFPLNEKLSGVLYLCEEGCLDVKSMRATKEQWGVRVQMEVGNQFDDPISEDAAEQKIISALGADANCEVELVSSGTHLAPGEID